MCLYPKLIKNRKYITNKKNKGIVPKIKDKRVLLVPVSCGKCMECKKKKSRDWQVRLSEEIRHNKNGKFVTFTFSDASLKLLAKEVQGLDGYELENEIARIAVRRFLERWRKKFKKSVRHWLITELGQTSTERIHLHGLLFTNENKETINERWGYGHTWKGDYVNEKTINYIVKYLHKQDGKHKEYMPKMFTSAGIGKGYTERTDSKRNAFKGKETKEDYRCKTGAKVGLPIYYRNKIYTEEEREKLWLQKLDENIRWVDGVKIDISKSSGS